MGDDPSFDAFLDFLYYDHATGRDEAEVTALPIASGIPTPIRQNDHLSEGLHTLHNHNSTVKNNQSVHCISLHPTPPHKSLTANGKSSIDRPSIINGQQSTRSTKTTNVRNNTLMSFSGVHRNKEKKPQDPFSPRDIDDDSIHESIWTDSKQIPPEPEGHTQDETERSIVRSISDAMQADHRPEGEIRMARRGLISRKSIRKLINNTVLNKRRTTIDSFSDDTLHLRSNIVEDDSSE